MKTLVTESDWNANAANSRQRDFEIVEHKTSGSIQVAPALVIGETAQSATKLFIAKTRSEIAGLDAFFKTLIQPAMKAK